MLHAHAFKVLPSSVIVTIKAPVESGSKVAFLTHLILKAVQARLKNRGDQLDGFRLQTDTGHVPFEELAPCCDSPFCWFESSDNAKSRQAGIVPIDSSCYALQMAANPSNEMPADPSTLAQLIVKTPGVCGGHARIAGTRIKVKHVYVWVEQMSMTPAQVVANYPHLTMAGVHAALAYYWSRRDEIHEEIADEERLVAEMKAGAEPSKVRERLAELDAADDSLSSR